MQCQAVAPAMQTHQETSLIPSVQVGTGRFISANDPYHAVSSQVFKQVVSNHTASYPFLSANKSLQVISFQFESANASTPLWSSRQTVRLKSVRLKSANPTHPSEQTNPIVSDQLDKRLASAPLISSQQAYHIFPYQSLPTLLDKHFRSRQVNSANLSIRILSNQFLSVNTSSPFNSANQSSQVGSNRIVSFHIGKHFRSFQIRSDPTKPANRSCRLVSSQFDKRFDSYRASSANLSNHILSNRVDSANDSDHFSSASESSRVLSHHISSSQQANRFDPNQFDSHLSKPIRPISHQQKERR